MPRTAITPGSRAVLVIESPGVAAAMSSNSKNFSFSSCSPLSAVIETATSCTLCSRRVAVTMISSSSCPPAAG
ncbi:MAG: hypothetical protein IPM40_07365 [Gammaproteobacteria bacterium]|nr:hypothetical protein [Gammaproteobacteria bacterium]